MNTAIADVMQFIGLSVVVGLVMGTFLTLVLLISVAEKNKDKED